MDWQHSVLLLQLSRVFKKQISLSWDPPFATVASLPSFGPLLTNPGCTIVTGGGGGGGVLRCCLAGGARLKPPNPYPSLSLRVILAGKGTHYYRVLVKKIMFLCTLAV